MSGPRPNTEYLEANSGRINYLLEQIDTRLAIGSTVIEQIPMDTDATIVSGGWSAEDMDEDFDPERAAELANWVLVQSVMSNFTALQAQATIRYDLDLLAAKQAEGLSEDEALAYVMSFEGFLNYETGQAYSKAYQLNDGRTLELVRSQIDGLEEYGEAKSYKAAVTDHVTEHSLGIVLIENQLEGVDLHVRPSSNPVLGRATDIMGVKVFENLSAPLSGRFENTDELDAMLESVHKQYQGTSHEDELGPLLEEVRSQAIAQKEFLEMGHNLTKPNQDDFEEFIGLTELAS